MSEQPMLTAEGAEKLRRELAELTGPKRDEIAKRLRSAIQMGDLSENADYHKAKEDQGFLEGRIQELEYLLKNAIIIEERSEPHELVDVGAKVTVQEEGSDPETYQIVGAKEADPRNGKISYESPLGKAVMGHKPGDRVRVETGHGEWEITIVGIE